MSTKAMSFSGVAPSPTPALDRGASAFYGDRCPAITTQSRASARSHSNPGLSSCIFLHGGAGWRGGN
jgi:hypothetical protein